MTARCWLVAMFAVTARRHCWLVAMFAVAALASCGFQPARYGRDDRPCNTQLAVAVRAYDMSTVNWLAVFETWGDGELTDCIPTWYPYVKKPTLLYELALGNARTGDVVDAYFVAEVTTESPEAAMLAWFMTVERPDGTVIHATEDHGTNVTLDQHHHTFGESMTFELQNDGDHLLRAYAYGATGPFEYLDRQHFRVERGYGGIYGKLFRRPR